MTILLEAVSYNPFIRAMDDYIICQLEVKYTDMRWMLERCCGEAVHDIYDTDAPRRHVLCLEPDHLRSMVSHLAMLTGSICFLFSLLLVICIPEVPYRRKRTAVHRRKMSPVADSLNCCVAVDEVKDEEYGVEMRDFKRHR